MESNERMNRDLARITGDVGGGKVEASSKQVASKQSEAGGGAAREGGGSGDAGKAKMPSKGSAMSMLERIGL